MKNPTAKKKNWFASWLLRYRLQVTIAIALIGALGAWSGLFSGTNVTVINSIPTPNQANLDDVEASESSEISKAEQKRIDALFDIARSRYKGVSNFLFADYNYHGSTARFSSGYVDIYAANQENYAKIDGQACSYPDGSQIQTDAEQGILFVSCSFDDWYRDHSDLDDETYSYTVTVVRFFESDKKISIGLSCSCIGVTVTSAELDMNTRVMQLTFVTTGTEVWVRGFDNDPIKLPLIEKSRSSGPKRILALQLDERWNVSDFRMVD